MVVGSTPTGGAKSKEGLMINESKSNKSKRRFYNMDIHIHTPASADFQTPEVTYLEILQKAESRGLDII